MTEPVIKASSGTGVANAGTPSHGNTNASAYRVDARRNDSLTVGLDVNELPLEYGYSSTVMFYIMLNETVPLSAAPRHREKVQVELAERSGLYCTTLVIEFEKRLSMPALLIAVAANS